MIEIIFSYLNRVKQRINSIIETGTSDMYGTGELGNVYYGPENSETVPDIIPFDKKILNDKPVLPLARPAHYRNLFIDNGVVLSTIGDWGTILVNDTLYLRGEISASNSHSGGYKKTSIVPDQLPKLMMFGETTYLATSPFFITGGTGNPCFGNAVAGGGFVGIYYGVANVLTSINTIGSEIPRLTDTSGGNVNVNSGTTGNAGGCLIIAARNIAIAEEGVISSCGGTGNSTSNKGLFCQYKMTGRSQI